MDFKLVNKYYDSLEELLDDKKKSNMCYIVREVIDIVDGSIQRLKVVGQCYLPKAYNKDMSEVLAGTPLSYEKKKIYIDFYKASLAKKNIEIDEINLLLEDNPFDDFFVEKIDVVLVAACKKSNIHVEGYPVVSSSEFFMDKSRRVKKEIDLYLKLYNVNPFDINLYFYQDEDKVTYYGTSITDIDINAINILVQKKVSNYTYRDFLAVADNYIGLEEQLKDQLKNQLKNQLEDKLINKCFYLKNKRGEAMDSTTVKNLRDKESEKDLTQKDLKQKNLKSKDLEKNLKETKSDNTGNTDDFDEIWDNPFHEIPFEAFEEDTLSTKNNVNKATSHNRSTSRTGRRNLNANGNANGNANEKKFRSAISSQRRISEKILRQINSWLNNTTFQEFYDEISQRVIGQDELKIVLANVYNYFRILDGRKRVNNNMIVTAPSGCGKTETFRALKDYFGVHMPDLPIAQIDMTQITEEGYKGKNTKDVVLPLLQKSETYGVGLIFMDEFDKKLVPSLTSNNTNVNVAVQSQLLALIEGTEFRDEKLGTIDTNNTMFIGLGSFDECRGKKEAKPNGIGFFADTKEDVDHYDKITREDIIELGALNEFLGRFPIIVNYHKLGAEAIDKIIDGIVYDLEDDYNCRIVISKKMREQLHQNSNSKFGCRLIDTKLRETIMYAYVDLLLRNNLDEDATIYLEEIGNAYIIDNNEVEEVLLETSKNAIAEDPDDK